LVKTFKGKAARNYSFLRQRPIDNFIVDFFCKELKLVIEIDGTYHNFQKKADKQRDKRLTELGFSVIHFQNEEVLNDILSIRKTLESFINEFENQAR
jgi:very-short-patch-repair endonuclease